MDARVGLCLCQEIWATLSLQSLALAESFRLKLVSCPI